MDVMLRGPTIDAAFLRGLRARDGSEPCAGGLAAGLKWIGKRRLPLPQALDDARGKVSSEFFTWACEAIGISGSGDGSGDGYGDGSGYGYGSGSGDGYGYGDGRSEATP